MLRTLRNQVILSQILPLLVVIPLMGVVLIYALERRYFLPSLEKDLTGDAHFLVELTQDSPDLWQDPQKAQALVDRYNPGSGKRLMLLAADGRLLASNDPEDREQINQIIQHPGLRAASSGRVVVLTEYNTRLQGEVVDIFAPSSGPGGDIAGYVRLTYRIATVADELLQMRYLIVAILVFGLLLGAALGLVLALRIERPVERVTQAITDLARGDQNEQLAERGPEELRLLVKAVNHLVERLHNLENSRRQLLANLIHELGRPLGALRMGIQVLQRGAKQDPRLLDELLAGMDEETERLQHLLDDLAHLHDQVLGTLELRRQPVLLAEWLPGVLRAWREAAREKRLEWEVDIPNGLPAVRADPVRLAQVVENLVSNAIKYTPVGGSITITAGEGDERVWIRVSDTGPGIPPEEQEKIFLPFYRGNQGRRIQQGMGLGLTIARDLVTAHQGQITLESTPGLGSQFTVWLPKN